MPIAAMRYTKSCEMAAKALQALSVAADWLVAAKFGDLKPDVGLDLPRTTRTMGRSDEGSGVGGVLLIWRELRRDEVGGTGKTGVVSSVVFLSFAALQASHRCR